MSSTPERRRRYDEEISGKSTRKEGCFRDITGSRGPLSQFPSSNEQHLLNFACFLLLSSATVFVLKTLFLLAEFLFVDVPIPAVLIMKLLLSLRGVQPFHLYGSAGVGELLPTQLSSSLGCDLYLLLRSDIPVTLSSHVSHRFIAV